MANTYENLGKMLSDVLDTGQIPQFRIKTKSDDAKPVQIKIPANVSEALKIFTLSFPCKIADLKKQYHLMLKRTHPDTKTNTAVLQKSDKTLTIDELTSAYQTAAAFISQHFPQASAE